MVTVCLYLHRQRRQSLEKVLTLAEKKITDEKANSNKVNYSYRWKSLAAEMAIE